MITYKGKQYREVKRRAKVGELIKIVDAGSHGPKLTVGDIHRVIAGVQPDRVYTDHSNIFHDCDTCEYVVLEPVENKRKCPTCGHEYTVTVTASKNTMPVYLYVQIGEDAKAGQLLEIREDGLAYRACAPKPKKRVYTAEQIAEAKDIVYRIMTESCRRTYAFEQYGNMTGCWQLVKTSRDHWTENKTATATCSDNDEWNDDIGRMVAICKLTGEPMPSWVRGE